ncbi:MAG: hypothetical protein IPK16_00165 [Anaerolineales bacterium]|nr:hypothetical protein [Anaerolineales bacterium]
MSEQVAVLETGARGVGAQASAPPDTQVQWLSLEHAAYAAVMVAAAIMRFANLGWAPLNSLEAAHAWPAWLAGSGQHVVNAPSRRARCFTECNRCCSLSGRMASSGHGSFRPSWACCWSACPGSGAVGSGGIPALLLAVFFAVDPWLVVFGRTADSTGLTLFFALLSLTALWRWRTATNRAARVGWERIGAVSLAFLVVSGPTAWSFIPVLLLMFFLFVWPITAEDRRTGALPSSLLWFAGALLLGATGFLMRPEATRAVAGSLTAWLEQARPGTGMAYPFWWPWVRLVADQPFLVIFGPIGLLVLALGKGEPRHGRRLALFLGVWLLWAVALMLLPGRSPFVLPLAGIPLAIAAVSVFGPLSKLHIDHISGLEITILIVVTTILLGSSAVWLAKLVESGVFSSEAILAAAILLGLMFVVWIAFGFWAGWEPALKLVGFFFLAVLLALTIHSSWLLNQETRLMRPSGFWQETTLPEARLLAQDIQRISSMRTGDPTQTEIQVITPDDPDPVLCWLLRDFRNVLWLRAPRSSTVLTDYPNDQPLIVTGAELAGDPVLANYLGSNYGIRTAWSIDQLPALPPVAPDQQGLPQEELERLRAQQAWSLSTQPRLEWLLYRNVKNSPVVAPVTLWAASAGN